MYSEIKYTGFDVIRDIGLRVLHKLIEQIVRTREEDERGNSSVDVEDVYNARAELCLARTIELVDADKLPTCPSTRSIMQGRTEGNVRAESRRPLIDALSHRYNQMPKEAV